MSTGIDKTMENKIDICLAPAWIWMDKIDWGHGLPISLEKYNAEKAKILDYWADCKFPAYDELHEYRKSFSTNRNYASSMLENNYHYHIEDKTNQFTTYSKNKKTKIHRNNNINIGYIKPTIARSVDMEEKNPQELQEYDAFEYDDTKFFILD